jgi:hypothetical protein
MHIGTEVESIKAGGWAESVNKPQPGSFSTHHIHHSAESRRDTPIAQRSIAFINNFDVAAVEEDRALASAQVFASTNGKVS